MWTHWGVSTISGQGSQQVPDVIGAVVVTIALKWSIVKMTKIAGTFKDPYTRVEFCRRQLWKVVSTAAIRLPSKWWKCVISCCYTTNVYLPYLPEILTSYKLLQVLMRALYIKWPVFSLRNVVLKVPSTSTFSSNTVLTSRARAEHGTSPRVLRES